MNDDSPAFVVQNASTGERMLVRLLLSEGADSTVYYQSGAVQLTPPAFENARPYRVSDDLDTVTPVTSP